MQRILFTGRVLPAIHTLTMPAYSLNLANDNFVATVSVEIRESAVTATFLVENFSQEMLGELGRLAIRITRASIDLVTFATGKGLTLILEHVTLPDGRSGPVDLSQAAVQEFCTAYSLQDIPTILNIVLSDMDMHTALSDLSDTITQPDRTQINCGRVVETIRTLVDPNPNRRVAWATLHDRLNLSAPYLRLITDQSAPHRHGDYTEVDQQTGNTIRERTWITMNRFLEYRKRGNQPLLLAEFPLLE
jgi:hypothetical protein